MLNSAERAKMDQAVQSMAEFLPLYLKELYDGYRERFTEQQAWELVKIAAFAMSGGKGIT